MIKYLRKLYYKWKYRHDKVVDVVFSDYTKARSIIIKGTERPDSNNVIIYWDVKGDACEIK